MTSGGLGGLQYSEDAVAAKLSLDIPAGAEEKLKELSRYSGDLSANMQSIARFTGDYMNYLQSFPTIQRQVIDLQREQLQVLQQTATAMGAIQAAQGSSGFVNAGFGGGYGGGYGTGREVQGGYSAQRLPPGYERFNGSSQQVGNNGNGGNGGNSNSNYQDELTRQSHVRDRVRERDQQDRQEEEHRRRNGHANGGTGGRHRREGDNEDEETPEVDDNGRRMARRIREGGQGAAGGINDIGQLFTPGGSNGARMSSIARLLGTTANAEGEGGSGLAGLLGRLPGSTPGAGLIGGLPMWAKGLGLAGAGVAAGTMAFNAVQNVGEGVQNLRNQDLKGHSLAGGLGVEKDVRLMAMNPLLTNDQSRDIIMGALKSGHSGDSYDSAVDFIKKNMIDMNMDVSKSVDLLKSNVDLGKQSIGSLTFDLLNTQALAGVGNKTTDQLSSEFKLVNDAMISQGVDGAVAGNVANGANALMNGNYNGKVNPLGQADANGNSPISKLLAGIIGQGDSNPLKSVMRQRFAPNSDPSLTYMATGADTTKDLMTILKEKCREMTLQQWVTYAYTYGLSAALGDTGNGLALTKAFWEQMNDKKFDAVAQAAANTASVAQTNIGGKDASTIATYEAFKAMPGNSDKTHDDYKAYIRDQTGQRNTTPTGVNDGPSPISRLAQSRPDAIVVRPDGTKTFLDPNSPEQATGLGDGTWKIMEAPGIKPMRESDGSISSGGANALGGALKKFDPADKKTYTLGEWQSSTGGGQQATPDGVGSTPSGSSGSSVTDSGSVDMGGNPTGAGGMQIGLTPEAKKLLTLSPFPGNVATDPNTLDSNAGANGATRNSPMLNGGGN